MGGDRLQIAEIATQKLEVYRQAKTEVENTEKLAQVRRQPSLGRYIKH